MMAYQTLDQQRAAFAWRAVTKANPSSPEFKKFKNFAKGAPALIMGNGLMPALAFYASRGKVLIEASEAINNAICAWLVLRYASDASMKPLPKTYPEMMDRLLGAPSSFYMAATDETLSMLRWLRQFADATDTEEG